MRKIVLATNNPSKVKELNAILASVGGTEYKVYTLADCGFTDEIVEDADTFEGNAYKKASTVAAFTGMTAIADDSGLEVDALGGAPGVYSARYAGEGASDDMLISKLLSELKDVPSDKRTARFTSVMCAVFPDGSTVSARGECGGSITNAPVGESGFGYDPVFLYTPSGKTFAQLSAEDKNAISHRSVATKKLVQILSKIPNDKFDTTDKT